VSAPRGAAPARRKPKINGKTVRELAREGLNRRDVARFLGLDESTIRKCKAYRNDFDMGQAERRRDILKWQNAAAEKGVPAVLIWLGKQDLGQRETPESMATTQVIEVIIGSKGSDPGTDSPPG
jgi:hypothetical protein